MIRRPLQSYEEMKIEREEKKTQYSYKFSGKFENWVKVSTYRRMLVISKQVTVRAKMQRLFDLVKSCETIKKIWLFTYQVTTCYAS